MFELEVVFPLNRNWEKINDKVKKAVGKHSDSSGAGFGQRDMQWLFKTRNGAENAAKRVKLLKISNVEIAIHEIN